MYHLQNRFLFLITLCVIALFVTTPLPGLSQGEMTFSYVPDHFPTQPDNQPIGPAHGGAAIDRAGNVYISTDTPRGILVFGRDGKYLRCFGPTQIHGLYLRRERDGEYLYAARPNFHEILKIKTDGTTAWTMGYPEASGIYTKAEEFNPTNIVALLKELAVYEKLLDGFTLTEEMVRRDMMGAACHCDLAFAGGEACGLITWFWTYKSFGARRGLFVEDLYVRPAARGRGLGKSLLTHLAAKARDAGGFLEWQVLDWNTPSIEFYKSLGARPVEQWLNYRLEGEGLHGLAP